LKTIQATGLSFLCAALVGSASSHAAMPYTQATVTRLQNTVTYGTTVQRATRAAKVSDVVKADSYLLTETDSRAELKYEDGSIVRIGQNTVFTFEADTRTLSLEKGSLVFYIPKGSGGGKIRTASITAAITGTIGKVSDNMIAILEGEITLIPSGRKVGAGQFAQIQADGTITIARFDPTKAMGGKLMDFGGKLAGFDESSLIYTPPSAENPVRDIMQDLENIDRSQNHPGAQEKFFPPEMIRPDRKVNVPPPNSQPGDPDGQY
jgi:hypothetical protein